MKSFKVIMRSGLAVAITMVLAGPSSAAITTRDCGKGLSGAAQKIEKFMLKAFTTCADTARQKGSTSVTAADKCEKALDGVYGKNPATDDTKTKIGKYLASIDKLIDADPNKSKCDAATLGTLGHLIPGSTAPASTEATGWAATWLFKAKESSVYKGALYEGVDLDAALGDMEDLTDIARPNLDYIISENPSCRAHNCIFDTASSSVIVNTAVLPAITVPLPGGAFSIEVCDLQTDPNLPITSEADYKVLINSPGKTFVPPPSLLGNAICVTPIRSQGYCSCVASALPIDVTLCQDHLATSAGVDTCTGAGVFGGGLEDCACGAGTVGAPCKTSGCTSCRQTDELSSATSRCHTANAQGEVELTLSGSQTVGSCIDLITVAVALVGGGELGTDGIACTDDDTSPPFASLSLPFTTGTSTATINNRVVADGACALGSTPGMNCAQDADCLGGTCSGEIVLPVSSANSGPGGNVTSCNVALSSNLAGVAFTGAFPALDVDLSLAAVDLMATFKLQCD